MTNKAKNNEKENKVWKKQICKLIDFSHKKGFDVEFISSNESSHVCFRTNTIYLNKKSSLELICYTFLHEIGHVLAMSRKKTYAERFGLVFVGFGASTLTSRVVQIEEEYDAWEKGLKLAKKLGLKLNRRKFETHKARCILTYAEALVMGHHAKALRAAAKEASA